MQFFGTLKLRRLSKTSMGLTIPQSLINAANLDEGYDFDLYYDPSVGRLYFEPHKNLDIETKNPSIPNPDTNVLSSLPVGINRKIIDRILRLFEMNKRIYKPTVVRFLWKAPTKDDISVLKRHIAFMVQQQLIKEDGQYIVSIEYEGSENPPRESKDYTEENEKALHLYDATDTQNEGEKRYP